MKLITYVSEGEGIRQCDRRSELVQSTLYTLMEISQ
jgi:hypothetical protein